MLCITLQKYEYYERNMFVKYTLFLVSIVCKLLIYRLYGGGKFVK